MAGRSSEFLESDPDCGERRPTEVRYFTVIMCMFLIQFQQCIMDYTSNTCVLTSSLQSWLQGLCKEAYKKQDHKKYGGPKQHGSEKGRDFCGCRPEPSS